MEETIACMGGELYVSLDAKNEQEVMHSLQKKLAELINIFDFFNSQSLLNQLNKERRIQYNPALAFVLEKSQELSQISQGKFNIFLGAQTTTRKQGGQVQPERPTITPVITITDTHMSVSGTAHIDLGGIAKGYILDALVKHVTGTFPVKDLLLDARGDLRCYGRTKKTIGVENPFSEEAFTTVVLSSGAVVTSGHNKQYFAGGSHIIGMETDVLTITLISKTVSCAVLDAYGTYLIQLSSAEALKLLELDANFIDVEALLVLQDGTFLQTTFWESF